MTSRSGSLAISLLLVTAHRSPSGGWVLTGHCAPSNAQWQVLDCQPVTVALPVLSAIEDGYEIYFVADASGGSSVEAHQLGIQRIAQAGARPMTWIGVISDLQYDWARKDTYDAVNDIVTQHAGAWGAGVNFVRAMKRAGTPN